MFSVFLQILKAGPGSLFLMQDKRPILLSITFRQLQLLQGYATRSEFCFSHCLISISSTSVVVRVVSLWSSEFLPLYVLVRHQVLFHIKRQIKKRKHLLRNKNSHKRPSTKGSALTQLQVKKVNVRKKLKKENARTDIRVFLSTQKGGKTDFHTHFWTLDILPLTLDIVPSNLDILPSTLDILPSTLDILPSTLDILTSTLDGNLHSHTGDMRVTYGYIRVHTSNIRVHASTYG